MRPDDSVSANVQSSAQSAEGEGQVASSDPLGIQSIWSTRHDDPNVARTGHF